MTFAELKARAEKAKAKWSVDETELYSIISALAERCETLEREIAEVKEKQQTQ